jgi:D-alanyl-lipoteichoic acid acyltransferase DltB (MBOAT superfamily)
LDNASFQFIFFGLAIAVLSNLSRSRIWRGTVLLLASLLLIALLAKSPLTLIPLAGFLLLGFLCLKLLERGWSRGLAFVLVAVVLVYVWLKKYTFFPDAVLLHRVYFTLGLSYIFFRVLHLLIEAGQNKQQPRVGLGAYLLYTLNFTTFVSGPIQRYEDFARDMFAAAPIPLGPRVVGLQLDRIVRGFFKVNVLAFIFDTMRLDALDMLARPISFQSKLAGGFLLAIAYPFFLYSNFSGYIDIVIALARLMRIELPENFDRPFSATSFIDFWSRWHITLSTWLKTYVYNPVLVALMRRISALALQPWLAVAAFFVTFFLVGVWHGRTSEFIFFGVLQGGGVAINKLWQLSLTAALGRKPYKALAGNAPYRFFARGLTFTWFAFTLFWFWSGWKQLGDIAASLPASSWILIALVVWFLASAVLGAWELIRRFLLSFATSEGPVLTSRYARVVYASAMGLIAVVFVLLLNQPAPDIVYKAF